MSVCECVCVCVCVCVCRETKLARGNKARTLGCSLRTPPKYNLHEYNFEIPACTPRIPHSGRSQHHVHAPSHTPHLQLAGCPEAGSLGQLRRDGRDDLVVGVAADGGAPAAHVVYVGVAVHISDLAALDAIENDGLAAHGTESPHGTVHTAYGRVRVCVQVFQFLAHTFAHDITQTRHAKLRAYKQKHAHQAQTHC